MHGQYYDYWCHGPEKSKVINRYGIDLITQNIEASVPEGIEAQCGLLDQQHFIALFGLWDHGFNTDSAKSIPLYLFWYYNNQYTRFYDPTATALIK